MTDHIEISPMGSFIPSEDDFRAYYRTRILDIQNKCSDLPQIDMPLAHDFAPGVYARRIFMPAGTFVIGKTHKTEHFNIVLSGIARVMIDGDIKTCKAGDLFVSKAGVKKVLYILSDMMWCTIHPTNETDLDELEKICVYSEKEEKKLFEKEIEKYAMRNEERRKLQGDEKRNQKEGR